MKKRPNRIKKGPNQLSKIDDNPNKKTPSISKADNKEEIKIQNSINTKPESSSEIDDGPDNTTNIPALIGHASIQDDLLQNYRQTHIFIQTILLALGGVLLQIILLHDNPFLRIMLVLICEIAVIRVESELNQIVKIRGEGVFFFHRRILITEQLLSPDQRSLTLFKCYQQGRGHNDNLRIKLLQPYLNIKEAKHAVDKLIKDGSTHTRIPIDKIINLSFQISWSVLLMILIIIIIKDILKVFEIL